MSNAQLPIGPGSGQHRRFRVGMWTVIIGAMTVWYPAWQAVCQDAPSSQVRTDVGSGSDQATNAVPDGGVGVRAKAPSVDPTHYWAQWRGPLGTGEAPHADPPIRWGEGSNVRWKIEVPGKGHATPIVWGDRVFVTTAVPVGDAFPARYSGAPGGHDEVPITHRVAFVAMAVDRGTGTVLWRRTLHEAVPHQGGHVTASLASGSPVTNGQRLIASFGTWGYYALDFQGSLLWELQLGQLDTLHGHGEGSSPAWYRDTLVINWDQEGESFVAAFNTETGRQLWSTPRPHASSWTTPLVVEVAGKPQVVVSGSRRVTSYDLATGRQLWACEGLSKENVVSSPVAGFGLVFVGSTYDKPGTWAIRMDGARGDITGSDHVVWRRSRGASYVPTPLLYGDALYYLAHFQGILTRVDAKSGDDRPGAFRLMDVHNVFASPVGAAGRVYVTSREGMTIVLKDGNPPELLARNRLEDHFSASPAVAGREFYLRGERFLYCLAEP